MAIAKVFEIEFTCGHTEECDLSSEPAGNRAGLAKWKATHHECSSCYSKARKNEKREERRVRDKADLEPFEVKHAMPELIGSEKQLPWARPARMHLVEGAWQKLVPEVLSENEFEEQVTDLARRVVSVRFWIDNERADFEDLPELLESVMDDPFMVCENDA